MKVPFGRSKAPEDEAAEMTLLGHLTELRKRLIRSVSAIIVGAIVVFILKDRILLFLRKPYCQFQLEATDIESCRFLVVNPLEPLSVVLTLSGYGGMLVALPVILYQLGRFVLPGLYPNEKKMLIPFAMASVLLLFGGMVAAYALMPRSLDVLQSFGDETFVPQFAPGQYIGFFVKMMLAFGFAAEFPVILIFLQLVGVVNADQLASNRRLAAVAVVILGAIITPTGDPFNLAIISIPMYLFYEVSIIIGRWLTRRRRSNEPAGSGLAG